MVELGRCVCPMYIDQHRRSGGLYANTGSAEAFTQGLV